AQMSDDGCFNHCFVAQPTRAVGCMGARVRDCESKSVHSDLRLLRARGGSAENNPPFLQISVHSIHKAQRCNGNELSALSPKLQTHHRKITEFLIARVEWNRARH